MCIFIILLWYKNKEEYSSKTKVNLSKVNFWLSRIISIQQINKKDGKYANKFTLFCTFIFWAMLILKIKGAHHM